MKNDRRPEAISILEGLVYSICKSDSNPYLNWVLVIASGLSRTQKYEKTGTSGKVDIYISHNIFASNILSLMAQMVQTIVVDD